MNAHRGKRRLALRKLYQEYSADSAFDELRAGATQSVPGSGNTFPSVLFIGEAPGEREDQMGLPFVGPSGKVLDKLLDGIGLDRRLCFITNIVKYRPPGNRDPLESEVEASTPYLRREIEILDPPVVCFLGAHALGALFPGWRISASHGKPWVTPGRGDHWWFASFHPATALYSPSKLGTLKRDFAVLKGLLE